jgi:large subunit ribosomal protein L22
MEARGYFKNLKIAPKKLRLLLPALKKLSPEQALQYLYYSPKKAARFYYKAIASTIANAKHTLKVDPHLLKFKLLTVEEGRRLKRYKSGGRGAVKPIRRDFAHIKIILEAVVPKIDKIPSAKLEKPLTNQPELTKADQVVEEKIIQNKQKKTIVKRSIKKTITKVKNKNKIKNK